MTEKKPMLVYAATYPSVSAAETDLVSRERDSLTSDYRSGTMAYAVDCERGGPAARP